MDIPYAVSGFFIFGKKRVQLFRRNPNAVILDGDCDNTVIKPGFYGDRSGLRTLLTESVENRIFNQRLQNDFNDFIAV